MLHIEVWPYL